MPKKEKSSFLKLSDALNKIAPDGDIIETSPLAKIDEWIPTGSYILNAALSGSLFGGLPNRRSLVLAGPEGTAKTYIALSICRQAQQMGYDIIYFDSEGSIDRDFVVRLGVDISRVRLQPVNTIEQFNHIVSQLIKSIEDMKTAKEEVPKILIVLDSLGNLSSEKEVSDSVEGSDKRDMTKQQQIRKLFRVNGLSFAKHGIPFIVNAHTYEKIGSYVPGLEVSGGGGVKYNASIIFELSKKKLDDEDAEKNTKSRNIDAVRVGVTITVKPIKQRFARPIKVELHIPFYKNPNPFVGLEKFVSWDGCGIIRGKALTEKLWEKLSDEDKKICRQFEGKNKEVLYALPKDTARTLVCKHEGGEVPLVELFTERVFTKEVLKELDEKVIRPSFELPSIESLEDLKEIEKEMTLEENEQYENQ
jgi:RecA/RadA recombinase